MMEKVQRQNRHQHQQPAELGKQEKLDGGVDSAFVSPQRDQEVHRDQHQFPGEVEQEQIDSQEHAGDAGQDPQHVQVKEAHAFGNFRPGSQNRNDAQKERQRQQQQAQSIESEVKVNAEFGNPNPINLFEPSAGAAEGDVAGVSYPEEHDQRRSRAAWQRAKSTA